MSAPRIMPLDVPAYLADTTHLSTAQHGAYLLILMAMWQHGGALADDERILAGFAKLSIDRWRKIGPPIRTLMKAVVNGKLSQNRLSIELGKVVERVEKNRASGSTGGIAKSLKNKDPTLATASLSLERKVDSTLSLFSEVDSESKIEGKKESKKESKSSNLGTARARGPHMLPEDWAAGSADLDYARQHGFSEIETTDLIEAFRNHHLHKGTKGLDWSRGWQLWVRNEIKFSGQRGGGSRPSNGHKITPADMALGRYRRTP